MLTKLGKHITLLAGQDRVLVRVARAEGENGVVSSICTRAA